MNNMKFFKGRKWLLVFNHKYETEADLFKSENEVLFCKSKNKFSVLGCVDESFSRFGKYEFLLEYPGHDGYNQWTQTKNPVQAEFNTENGYEPISVSWTSNDWHGLSKSSATTATFIDGSPFNSQSFYSIGMYTKWLDSMPAYINLYEWKSIDSC